MVGSLGGVVRCLSNLDLRGKHAWLCCNIWQATKTFTKVFYLNFHDDGHLLCVLRDGSLVRGSREFGAVVVHVSDDNDQAEVGRKVDINVSH